jgi:hypothetical protein
MTTETSFGQLYRSRQLEAMQRGWHALAVPLQADIRLHPAAALLDGKPNTRGRRCGNCRFRTPVSTGTENNFYKCHQGGDAHPRATPSPATDVRKWWPACLEHEVA